MGRIQRSCDEVIMKFQAVISTYLATTIASIATRRGGYGWGTWMAWMILAGLLVSLVDTGLSVYSSQRVHQSQDTIIYCTLPVNYQKHHWVVWHKGHKAVQDLGSRFSVNPQTGGLHIAEVEVEDEGNYTCSAGWGKRFEPHTVMLYVSIPPGIKVTSKNPVSPRVLDTLTISCRATGRPVPAIMWYSSQSVYISNNLTEPGSRFSIQERQSGDTTLESFLVVSPVFAEDRGSFVCKATNVVGSSKDNVIVDVQQKPVLVSPSENLLVYWWEGHKANLTCQSTGNPTPVIRWTFVDETARLGHWVPLVDIRNGLVTSNLWLPETKSFPLPMTCECSAENMYGVTSPKQFTVKEAFVPQTPVVHMLSIDDDEAVMSIHIPGKETLPVTYVSAHYRLEEGITEMDDGIHFKGNGTILTLRGIMLHYRYVIRIKALNKVGWSNETVLRIYAEVKKYTIPPSSTSIEGNTKSENSNQNSQNDVTLPTPGGQMVNETTRGSEGQAMPATENRGEHFARLSYLTLISTVISLGILRR